MDTVTHVCAFLRRRHIDAFLITEPHNRRYLSGYTAADHGIQESAGALVVTRHRQLWLLTDFRYQAQAAAEAGDWEIHVYQGRMTDLLVDLLARAGLTSLAFEENYILYSTYRRLRRQTAEKGIELHPLRGVIERRRAVKSAAEIERIRRSVALNEEVFQSVLPRITPGRTEREVAAEIEAAMIAKGAEGPSFETIVASGPNAALPHAVPGDRRLSTSEPIVIDMGLVLDGYCSDMTRTIVLGPVPEQWRRIFRLVRQAQLAAAEALVPGAEGRKVDAAARSIIRAGGHGPQFGHALGHGVGLAVHEAPRLSRLSRARLRPGMVVTIEPGIYLEGRGGVRLENMAVVTEDGCDILNTDTTFLDL